MIYINRIHDFHRRSKAKRPFPRIESGLDVCLYGYTIDAHDLCRLIQRYKGRLQDARLGPFTIRGDISYLAESFLLSCSNLQELDFSLEISPTRAAGRTSAIAPDPPTTDTPSSSLSVIAEALNSCLQLETVRISKHCVVLVRLLQNPMASLRKITLEDYGATHDDLHQFYRACQVSASLQELLIRPVNADHFCSSGQIYDLGQLIRQTSSLRVLHIEDKNTFDFGGTTGRNNNNNPNQRNHNNAANNSNRHNRNSEDTLPELPPVVQFDSLAQDLRFNQSLRRLTIDCCGWFTTQTLHQQEVDAFHDTLRHHNFTLEELDITPRKSTTSLRAVQVAVVVKPATTAEKEEEECQTASRTQIQFLLSLNKMGRNQVLGRQQQQPTTTNMDAWIQCIANSSQADDLSAVYFFLRNNPCLCQIVTTTTNTHPPPTMLLEKQQQQGGGGDDYSGGVVVVVASQPQAFAPNNAGCSGSATSWEHGSSSSSINDVTTHKSGKRKSPDRNGIAGYSSSDCDCSPPPNDVIVLPDNSSASSSFLAAAGDDGPICDHGKSNNNNNKRPRLSISSSTGTCRWFRDHGCFRSSSGNHNN